MINDGPSQKANTIAQTCDFLSIPVMGLSNRDNHFSDPHMHGVYLRTVPPYSHQVDVWIEMLQTLNYSHVVFIHSADYSGRTAFSRFQSLAEGSIQIRSIIEYESGVTDFMKELEEADEEIKCRVYLLYADEIAAQSIFLDIIRLNMTEDYVWIVSETALRAANVPDGVLALSLYNASNGSGHIMDSAYVIGMAIRDMYELDGSGENITGPPSQCGDLNRNRWSRGPLLFNYMRKQLLLYGKTGRVAFDGKGDRIDADYEIVNRVNGRSVTVGQYAFSQAKMRMQLWFNINSIVWPGYRTVQPLGYVRPSHLRVVTLQEEPFIFTYPVASTSECSKDQVPCAKYDQKSGIEQMYCCSGYCIDFLIGLSDRLNFSYTLYQVDDGAYGSLEHVDGPDKAKKWTGLMGDLIYKKADIIVAPLTINPERSAAIEFSKPFKYQGITILEKKLPKRDGLASFLHPFEESLWILVLFSVHIIALTLYLLDRFSPFGRYRLPNSDITEEDALNLSSAIWFAWGVLLNSGIGEGSPRSLSGRVLGMVWAGFAMIVIASYTANLAAFLVLERPISSLSGINDIRLRSPRDTFSYATVKQSAVENYFKRQIELKPMYDFMLDKNYKSVEEGVAAVKSDEISAFIWDSSRLEWEAARDCDLITAAEQFGRSGYGVGLQKNSFWTDQMNAAILSMHENGIMTELDKKWILEVNSDVAMCSNRIDGSPTTLGLKNMAGVFVLLVAGIIGGVALIFIEILYKRRQTKQQRQLEVARSAMDRWKKLVERRRLYHEGLRQLRKEQLRQEHLRNGENMIDYIYPHSSQQYRLRFRNSHGSGDQSNSKDSISKSSVHFHDPSDCSGVRKSSAPHTSSSDRSNVPFISPFTVERGLSEIKFEDTQMMKNDEISERQSGCDQPLLSNQSSIASSSRKSNNQSSSKKSKKSGRSKDNNKRKNLESNRSRRILYREKSINIERGSSPDTLLADRDDTNVDVSSSGRLSKAPHELMQKSQPSQYPYDFGYPS
ncbi:glutamate [NMDA] receptor subunit 1-like isoform X2 [Brevipalpus obovatus]